MKRSVKLRSLGVVIVLFVGACKKSPPPAPPPPPAVTIAKPLKHEIIEWDEFIGQLEAVETVDVRARVGGFITSAPFQDGALVKKGDLLFELDPRPFQATLDAADANVERAQAEIELARSELSRQTKLRADQAGTEKEFQDARSKLRTAEASAMEARAKQTSAALDVEFTKVHAPIAGRISRKLITEGNLISGGGEQGTLLTTIISVDPIYCYVDVDEGTVLKYQRLSREKRRSSARDGPIVAYIALADTGNFAIKGQVDFVENRMDAGTGTVRARGVFDNKDGYLTPGFFARLRVAGSGRYEAICVPDTAIGTDQNKKTVYVVTERDKDGKRENITEVREIQTGYAFSGLRVVTAGLTGDEWVIINGTQRVRPGGVVNPERSQIPFRDEAAAGATEPATLPDTRSATSQPTALPAAGSGQLSQIQAPATQPARSMSTDESTHDADPSTRPLSPSAPAPSTQALP